MHRIRCAIYTRKSSEEGLDQDFNLLDAKREACEAYVASQLQEGWVLHARRGFFQPTFKAELVPVVWSHHDDLRCMHKKRSLFLPVTKLFSTRQYRPDLQPASRP